MIKVQRLRIEVQGRCINPLKAASQKAKTVVSEDRYIYLRIALLWTAISPLLASTGNNVQTSLTPRASPFLYFCLRQYITWKLFAAFLLLCIIPSAPNNKPPLSKRPPLSYPQVFNIYSFLNTPYTPKTYMSDHTCCLINANLLYGIRVLE